MKYLTAEKVARDAAPFLGLSYENDRDRLFLYLSMAQKKAWSTGIYKGHLKSFDVETYEVNGHRYIKTPHGFNVLMGLNLEYEPAPIMEGYFRFHHNGPGSNDQCFRDYGLSYYEFATLQGPQINNPCDRFKLGVLNTFDATGHVCVTGLNELGHPVNTVSDGVSVDGVKFNFNGQHAMQQVENITWSQITGITKSPTIGPVEIYSIKNNDPKLIARLEPNQLRSLYRVYELPKSLCGCRGAVHGLFKVSEPEDISRPTDQLIVDDFESLLNLMMSVDQGFNTKDLNLSQAFMAKGISGLAEEERAGKGPTVAPPQFVGPEFDEESNHYVV